MAAFQPLLQALGLVRVAAAQALHATLTCVLRVRLADRHGVFAALGYAGQGDEASADGRRAVAALPC